ncbi:pyrimidine/purine nucleoside phosphorylase [Sphaerotilus sp.]|jgi:purine/pyrimidine-nucleoside phosphorylase|uniref:pyrimidine/purine nucleoside phosphorylase n=1 Tax=Sphaerotilus sp. TaxID=2093942 RepID=UPI0025D06508|nr:pyrimidine/purine nucleoside phosphorylase [Sphaerotilus sp.]
MSNEQLSVASVGTKANVYFDGRCVSHGITLADGTKKSVGVILPASLTFNTGAPEIMETVAGACSVLLPGQNAWQTFGPGQSFNVPGNASFQIRVEGEPYHYICHFG